MNHEMRDFATGRRKKLDLVIARPRSSGSPHSVTFADLVETYQVQLTDLDRLALAQLPTLESGPVGSVVLALEAKATMTAHQKALPRLYDELNSSHLTVHGASAEALAVGAVMVNASDRFLSSDMNKRSEDRNWAEHPQPKSVQITLDKVRELPRRSNVSDAGYDALGICVVSCRNDGSSVALEERLPAPQPDDEFHYESMIVRISQTYSVRFGNL